jgi:hypothetical protein
VTKLSLLLIFLVALALPCAEVPEWLTRCDDPANDFVLMTSKPDAVSFHVIQSDSVPQLQRACASTRLLPPHSTFTSELPFVTGQELLILFSLQKK